MRNVNGSIDITYLLRVYIKLILIESSVVFFVSRRVTNSRITFNKGKDLDAKQCLVVGTPTWLVVRTIKVSQTLQNQHNN